MTEDVFSSDTTDTVTKDVFEGDTSSSSEQTENYLEELVGEGKKFKDLNTLARSKVESDKFIKKLQDELNELRGELTKQEYSKELLEQLKNKATDPGSVTNNSGQDKDSTTKSKTLSTDDVKDLVEKHLKEEETRRTTAQNIAKASEEVRKLYGEKTNEVLQTKAQELGMSLDRMREIAAESPTAFLRLIGGASATTTSTNLPKSGVNTTNFSSQTDERNFEYYQKLRRENKRKYYSPEVQKQMWLDMRRLGQKFGV